MRVLGKPSFTKQHATRRRATVLIAIELYLIFGLEQASRVAHDWYFAATSLTQPSDKRHTESCSARDLSASVFWQCVVEPAVCAAGRASRQGRPRSGRSFDAARVSGASLVSLWRWREMTRVNQCRIERPMKGYKYDDVNIGGV